MNGKDTWIVRHGRISAFVLAAFCAGGAWAATPNFAAEQGFALDTTPLLVIAVDLNSDGKPDLVSGSNYSDGISVLINTSSGGSLSFANPVDMQGSFSVAVADVNGDGKPDLIVPFDSDGAMVYVNTTPIGSATATFDMVYLGTGAGPFTVAAADLNGDGMPDIIVGNSGDNTISVFINTTTPGNATASFAAGQIFAAGNYPQSIAVGDLNGDGKSDIVVDNTMDNTISVLVNATANGASSASFDTQQVFPVGELPNVVTLADINNDGKLDVVIGNNMENFVSILRNTTTNGSGTVNFAAEYVVPTGNTPDSLAVADVDGDGMPDLIVGNAGDNTVSFIPNTTTSGSASLKFGTRVDFYTGNDPEGLVVADLNGDGKLDIATANLGDSELAVLLGQ
ncbi:MAG: FG-GAP repeat domain-containing protein [Bacillota bacterium]